MLSLLNPWVLVGVLSLVVSSYFYGHHEAYVEQEAEVARLNLVERDKEEQMRAMANAKSRELERANNDAKAKITQLQSDIDDHKLRLYVATRPVQASEHSPYPSRNTEARAELDPEVAKSLIAITADGDSAIRKLNACIDIYNQVRSKQ
jgi:hypothetical protein